MKRIAAISFFYLGFSFSWAQSGIQPNDFNASTATFFKEKAEAAVKNYYSQLSLLVDPDYFNDMETYIMNIESEFFMGPYVRVEADLSAFAQGSYRLGEYLLNLAQTLGPDTTAIRLNSAQAGPVYYDSTGRFNFIVVLAERELIFKNRNGAKKDKRLLDIYFRIDPKSHSKINIFSIQMHRNDLVSGYQEARATDNAESMQAGKKASESALTTVAELKPGQLFISTLPGGAGVTFIDYPDFGTRTTPVTVTYPVGRYRISISRENYEPLETTIQIGKDKAAHFELTPTCSFLKLSVDPKEAHVIIDDQQMGAITGIRQKIAKGKHAIMVSADHYYSQETAVEAKAGETQHLSISLKPKTGLLTVGAGNEFARGAVVFFDSEMIGIIPFKNAAVREGMHMLKIRKDGFATMVSTEHITGHLEKELSIRLWPAADIKVVTEPPGARITINGKLLGISDLSASLAVGDHTIKIEKENYEAISASITIHENDAPKTFSYTLVPLKYDLFINSRPGHAIVYVDGYREGHTPVTIRMAGGRHKITLEDRNAFKQTFIKNVVPSAHNTLKKNLLPRRFINLNILAGPKLLGLELGVVYHRFSVAYELLSIKNDLHHGDVSAAHANASFYVNAGAMHPTGQKISACDSAASGSCLKLGFMIIRPFKMRIHAGYGAKTFTYNDIYRVSKSAVLTGTNGAVYAKEGELLKGSPAKKEHYSAFIAGVEVPLFTRLNLLADCWFSKAQGYSVVFGLGFNFFKQR